MPKSTKICLWWLKSHNFKLIYDGLSLKLKIGVIKILIYMAIKINNTEKFLRIKSTEINLDPKVVSGSLFWLSKVKIISILNDNDWKEKDEYIIKYSEQENDLRIIYDDCWVNLPNQKILSFLKRTSNEKDLTFESIYKYLFLIKKNKYNLNSVKPIIYDEDYINGDFRGTWREVLIKFDLIEFWESSHVDIY